MTGESHHIDDEDASYFHPAGPEINLEEEPYFNRQSPELDLHHDEHGEEEHVLDLTQKRLWIGFLVFVVLLAFTYLWVDRPITVALDDLLEHSHAEDIVLPQEELVAEESSSCTSEPVEHTLVHHNAPGA
jgi:hypothetical protein